MNVCRSSSRDTIDKDAWTLLHDEDHVNGTVTGLVLLAFILVGLTWNVLVLITILKEKLYVQPSIVLLISLVSTDIIILLFPTPLMLITGLSGEFLFGSSDCSILGANKYYQVRQTIELATIIVSPKVNS